MKRLHELAIKSLQKEFYSVLSGTHNDTWEVAGPEYYRRLKTFIDNNNLVGKSHGTQTVTEKTDKTQNVEESVSPTGSSGKVEFAEENEEDCVEDPDYLMVSKNISLPTMGKNFQVK